MHCAGPGQVSGTTVKFNGEIDRESNMRHVTTCVGLCGMRLHWHNMRYGTVTAMPAYAAKSVDQLRWEDYQAPARGQDDSRPNVYSTR